MKLKDIMPIAERQSKVEKAKSGIKYADNEGVWMGIYETQNEKGELDYNLEGTGKKVVSVEATKNGVVRRWY